MEDLKGAHEKEKRRIEEKEKLEAAKVSFSFDSELVLCSNSA